MYSSVHSYIPLFILLLISIFAIILIITKDKATPISIWFIAWITLFSCAYIFGAPYSYTFSTLWLLTLGCIAFGFGGVIAYTVKINSSMRLQPLIYDTLFLKITPRVQIIAVLLGVFGAINLSIRLGSSLLSTSSLSQVFDSASSNISQLYTGETVLSPLANISFSFIQLGFLVSGAHAARFGLSSKRSILLFAAIFLTAILWTSITTTRSYFIVSMVWWVSAYYSTKVLYNRIQDILSVKPLIIALLTMLLLIVLIVSFQTIRLGNEAGKITDTFEHMRPWIAGYIPALSVWISENWNGEHTYGLNLVRPPLKIIGVRVGESLSGSVFPIEIGNLQQSNALTIYRVLFYDFGYIGCLIFTFTLGFLSSIGYRLCALGSLPAWAALVSLTALIIWSPNYWFYNYGSRILVLIIILAGAFFFRNKHHDAPRTTNANT